jgi:hypothetical protein
MMSHASIRSIAAPLAMCAHIAWSRSTRRGDDPSGGRRLVSAPAQPYRGVGVVEGVADLGAVVEDDIAEPGVS